MSNAATIVPGNAPVEVQPMADSLTIGSNPATQVIASTVTDLSKIDAPDPGVAASGNGLIAGKFRTDADLATATQALLGRVDRVAAYKALETLLGQQPPPVQPGAASDHAAGQQQQRQMSPITGTGLSATATITPLNEGDGDIGAILQRAGLDNKTLAEQWSEHGEFTPDQYAALAKQGIFRSVADAFMSQQTELAAYREADTQARQADAKGRALQLAGGEDQFKNLIRFKNTLPEARRADLDRRLDDFNLFEGAIREIMAEHSASLGAAGSQPQIFGGQPAIGVGGATGFSSGDELYSSQKASNRSHGHWRNDPLFMARLQATPRHIINGAR